MYYNAAGIFYEQETLSFCRNGENAPFSRQHSVHR
jgi:hypothetical protein